MIRPGFKELSLNAAQGRDVQRFREAKAVMEKAINTISPPPLQGQALDTVLQSELDVGRPVLISESPYLQLPRPRTR